MDTFNELKKFMKDRLDQLWIDKTSDNSPNIGLIKVWSSEQYLKWVEKRVISKMYHIVKPITWLPLCFISRILLTAITLTIKLQATTTNMCSR